MTCTYHAYCHFEPFDSQALACSKVHKSVRSVNDLHQVQKKIQNYLKIDHELKIDSRAIVKYLHKPCTTLIEEK